MNLGKGFFRLTLVLSFLCGILSLIFWENYPFLSRYINITIPLPSDWENKTLQEKLSSIDELLILERMNEKGKELRTPGEGWEVFALSEMRRRLFLDDYSKLTSTEQQNVKTRLREQIISDERKLPKDREGGNYYVSSGPDWKELSLVLFIRFIIGFGILWLIYAFLKWVVFRFIVRGFKAKSVKGGEPDQP
jgi:hypothetical protein